MSLISDTNKNIYWEVHSLLSFQEIYNRHSTPLIINQFSFFGFFVSSLDVVKLFNKTSLQLQVISKLSLSFIDNFMQHYNSIFSFTSSTRLVQTKWFKPMFLIT